MQTKQTQVGCIQQLEDLLEVSRARGGQWRMRSDGTIQVETLVAFTCVLKWPAHVRACPRVRL